MEPKQKCFVLDEVTISAEIFPQVLKLDSESFFSWDQLLLDRLIVSRVHKQQFVMQEKALLRFIIFNVFMLPYLGMLRGSYTVETVVTSNAWILSAAEPFIKFLFTCKCMEKTNNEKKRPLRVHINIYWTIYWCQMVKFALAATINYIGAPNGMIPCVAITKPGGRM